MKLVRFGAAGEEKPGLVDAEGVIRDLSAYVADIGPAELAPAALARLAAIDPATLPAAPADVRLGAPVAGVPKFIAIGLNYKDHAAEANQPLPAEPVVFMKATSCIQGATDPVMIPKDAQKVDWEVELGVMIGSTARYASEDRALDHVAGYCVINDVSERAYQWERGGTWDKGKGCDTFGPIGPWLVTSNEVGDPQTLGMWLDVNGKRMQDGTTGDMVFGVASIIAYVSRFMTLVPGDIIATGTPAGVGFGKKPQPIYLKAGDVMTLGIDKLGAQRQELVGWR